MQSLFRRGYDLLRSHAMQVEILAHALWDLARGLPAEERADLDRLRDVTVLIKTFERPKCVRRALRSLQRLYPTAQILVVDDSRRPIVYSRTTPVLLPFNVGASAGRNIGLDRVSTPYVLLMDDDVLVHRRTGLVRALRTLQSHSEIDVVGGQFQNLPKYGIPRFDGRLSIRNGVLCILPGDGSTIGSLPVCDIVHNFFIARTESVRKIRWDERLKTSEHFEFFLRARGKLTIVYDRAFTCLHASERPIGYTAFRYGDAERFETLALRKHGLRRTAWSSIGKAPSP